MSILTIIEPTFELNIDIKYIKAIKYIKHTCVRIDDFYYIDHEKIQNFFLFGMEQEQVNKILYKIYIIIKKAKYNDMDITIDVKYLLQSNDDEYN